MVPTTGMRTEQLLEGFCMNESRFIHPSVFIVDFKESRLLQTLIPNHSHASWIGSVSLVLLSQRYAMLCYDLILNHFRQIRPSTLSSQCLSIGDNLSLYFERRRGLASCDHSEAGSHWNPGFT